MHPLAGPLPSTLRRSAANDGSAAPPALAPARADDEADRACVREVLQGRRERFDVLVRRHHARVHRFLLRHTQQPDDALDLAQDTFLQAYLKLPAWRGDSRFSTWLLGVALNLARNHANRSPRLRHVHVALDDTTDRADLVDANDPGRALAQKARRAAIEAGIAALPPELRAPLVLVAIEGRSYEEALALLQIPAGTLKSRLNRARRLLRAALSDHLDASAA